MANPFADIETTLAAVSVAALSNAAATLPDGTSVDGLFDSRYADPLGMVNNQPRFAAPSSDLASLEADDEIIIADTAYQVRSIEPDGAGITALILRAA